MTKLAEQIPSAALNYFYRAVNFLPILFPAPATERAVFQPLARQ